MTSPTTSSHAARRLALATSICALVAGLVLLAGGSEGRAQAPAADSGLAKAKPGGRHHGGGHGGKKSGKPDVMDQPNVVMVMTDDQSKSTVLPESMPNLFTKLMPRGTTFSDYTVTTPLCCPSRAAYLTGEYGHNNGVLRNAYGDLIQKRNVLPSWLQHAGYNTAHVGKFLNGYEQGDLGPAAVAPGWDLWFTQLEKRRYYNWKASKNGKVRHYGTDDSDQATTVTSDFATRWTKRLVRKKAPFYMQVDYYAPHTSTGRDTRCASGPVPEPEDEHRFDTYPLPIPPNYNEADVSDKPDDIKQRPQLTPDDQLAIERRYRCTLESVYGVDRGLGRIYDEIARKKELNDTVFIFTSDNGFFYGEHRISKGKPDPYEENLSMPMTMVVPPKYRNRVPVLPTSNAPVASIDLAPTIMDLADSDPCRTKRVCRVMDGRSMLPIMNGVGGFPQPRALEFQLYDCDYQGVRYDGYVYVEHSIEQADGCQRTDTELYNLNDDPYELQNLFPTHNGNDQQSLNFLQGKLSTLQDCAGVEGRDPEPASGHYCD
jgi:N-acetylglucosamine-6-sulfatase